ncbi:MAG: diacylglycerol kinase family protein [Clostridia bacterium]|nr:diacylglycerol kinase family protein [Clostridia bacterium]
MEKRKWQTENFVKSFKYAISGIVYGMKTQRNIIIQLCFAVLAIFLGAFLEISKIEWIVIIFTIMFVIFAEMINTAVETVIDLITEEYNKKAKIAKDVAAGAVLISAINAICMGLIIYLDKILALIK